MTQNNVILDSLLGLMGKGDLLELCFKDVLEGLSIQILVVQGLNFLVDYFLSEDFVLLGKFIYWSIFDPTFH